MDKVFYEKVDLNNEKPSVPGKYVIFTESFIKSGTVFIKHENNVNNRIVV